MSVQEKEVRRKKNVVDEKVQFFENLANVAATNTETDLAISLWGKFHFCDSLPRVLYGCVNGHIAQDSL